MTSLTTLSERDLAALVACTQDGFVRLGSLALRVRSSDARYGDMLASLFKQLVRPQAEAMLPKVDGSVLVVDEATAGVEPWGDAIAPDGVVVRREEHAARLVVATEVVLAVLDESTTPFDLLVVLRPGALEESILQLHLTIVIHKVLLALQRAYLHAAAVSFGGRVHLFVGHNGAGKSTISLWLASRGGKVLSDDHVILKRSEGRYLVSGCEDTSRVTAATEAFIFERALPLEAREFGGLAKKEFPVRDFFPSVPHRDYPIDRVFFTRVGRRFAVRRVPRQGAVVELMARTRHTFRFHGPDDSRAFLDFWCGLAKAISVFDLELSPDLTELEHLARFLEGSDDASHEAL